MKPASANHLSDEISPSLEAWDKSAPPLPESSVPVSEGDFAQAGEILPDDSSKTPRPTKSRPRYHKDPPMVEIPPTSPSDLQPEAKLAPEHAVQITEPAPSDDQEDALVSFLADTELRSIPTAMKGNPGLSASTLISLASCSLTKDWVATPEQGGLESSSNTFTLVVADSGVGKSVICNGLMGAVRSVEESQAEDLQKDRGKLLAHIELCKITLTDLRKKAAKEGANRLKIAEDISRVNQQKLNLTSQLRRDGRFIFTNVTEAGIETALSRLVHRRGAIVQPDGRRLLGQLFEPTGRAGRPSLAPVFLNTFGDEDNRRARGDGSGITDLRGARLAVLLMVQPDLGIRFFKHEPTAISGLGARFLLFRFKESSAAPSRLPDELDHRWKATLEGIQCAASKDDESPQIQITADGGALLEKLGIEYRDSACTAAKLVVPAINKAAEQIGRLAIIHALLRHYACDTPIVSSLPDVTSEDILAAKRVVDVSLANHEKILDEALDPTAHDPEAQKLQEALKAAGGRIPRGEMRVSTHGLSKAAADELIYRYPQLFGIRKVQTNGRGQPPKEYYSKP